MKRGISIQLWSSSSSSSFIWLLFSTLAIVAQLPVIPGIERTVFGTSENLSEPQQKPATAAHLPYAHAAPFPLRRKDKLKKKKKLISLSGSSCGVGEQRVFADGSVASDFVLHVANAVAVAAPAKSVKC